MDTSGSLLDRLGDAPTDDDWRRLDDLYRPLLCAWAARAGVPLSDTNDVAQEVLIVVFREVAGFKRRRQGAFRAWLRTILTNRVRAHFRGKKYLPTAIGDSDILKELETPDSSLSKLWDREHNEHVVKKLLERVKGDFPETWEAFRRYVMEGEPAAQVAAALGMTLNAVLLAKSRVLERMRQESAGLVD
jgi:RNA polymerase sigma-70 factor (ECF subfamily)